MIDPQFALIRNLDDAGCDKTTQKLFLQSCSDGNVKESMRILQRQRTSLLDEVHDSQKKIDALDFLIFKMRRNSGT